MLTDYIAERGLHLPGQTNLNDDDVLSISDNVRKGIVQSNKI